MGWRLSWNLPPWRGWKKWNLTLDVSWDGMCFSETHVLKLTPAAQNMATFRDGVSVVTKIKLKWGDSGGPNSVFLVSSLWESQFLVRLIRCPGSPRRRKGPGTLEVKISSVQFSRLVMSDSLWPHESQHARPPCPSPTPRVYSYSCPSSWWCHPAISSSVVPFSSCPQSHPTSGSFPMSQLFEWSGQRTGVSASASVLPMNSQDWSPLGWTGWISLQSKGLSRVFSNTTVQKHQFFSAAFFTVHSHIHTWPLEKS